jgi:hypothetical protein
MQKEGPVMKALKANFLNQEKRGFDGPVRKVSSSSEGSGSSSTSASTATTKSTSTLSPECPKPKLNLPQPPKRLLDGPLTRMLQGNDRRAAIAKAARAAKVAKEAKLEAEKNRNSVKAPKFQGGLGNVFRSSSIDVSKFNNQPKGRVLKPCNTGTPKFSSRSEDCALQLSSTGITKPTKKSENPTTKTVKIENRTAKVSKTNGPLTKLLQSKVAAAFKPKVRPMKKTPEQIEQDRIRRRKSFFLPLLHRV